MEFSFDEYFDPILRDGAKDLAEKMPWVFRGAFLDMADWLIKASIDEAVKAILSRIVGEWLRSRQSQPFVGFALASVSKDEARTMENAGISPIVVLTIIEFAIRLVERWKGRNADAARVFTAASGDGDYSLEAMAMAACMAGPPPSDRTLEVGEKLTLTKDDVGNVEDLL